LFLDCRDELHHLAGLAQPRRTAQQVAPATPLSGKPRFLLAPALLFLASLLRFFPLAPRSYLNVVPVCAKAHRDLHAPAADAARRE